MRIRITPYAGNSQSARVLATALNEKLSDAGLPEIKRTLMRNSTYVANNDDFIINWGIRTGRRSQEMQMYSSEVLNTPDKVEVASDKLQTFYALSGHALTPTFTGVAETARRMLLAGQTVVCRSSLRGSGGSGITIVRPGEELPECPLYTKLINKSHEYRVHVLGDEVHIRQKRRRLSEEEPNWDIRNHENGFVMAQNCSYIPPQLEEVSLRAVKALGLDFGAVDVVYDEDTALCYVLEVNTAPGLEGSTVGIYADYFFKQIKSYTEEKTMVQEEPETPPCPFGGPLGFKIGEDHHRELTCAAGRVRFHIEQLPGNCGITMIYHVEWYPNTRYEDTQRQLERTFEEFLCTDYTDAVWDGEGHPDYNDYSCELNRSTLLVSDAEWGEGEDKDVCSLWSMCVRSNRGWEQSNSTVNANSDNHISVFTYCRPEGEYSEN